MSPPNTSLACQLPPGYADLPLHTKLQHMSALSTDRFKSVTQNKNCLLGEEEEDERKEGRNVNFIDSVRNPLSASTTTMQSTEHSEEWQIKFISSVD